MKQSITNTALSVVLSFLSPFLFYLHSTDSDSFTLLLRCTFRTNTYVFPRTTPQTHTDNTHTHTHKHTHTHTHTDNTHTHTHRQHTHTHTHTHNILHIYSFFIYLCFFPFFSYISTSLFCSILLCFSLSIVGVVWFCFPSLPTTVDAVLTCNDEKKNVTA